MKKRQRKILFNETYCNNGHFLNSSSFRISLHSFLESKILNIVIIDKIIKKIIKNILLNIISLSMNINNPKNKTHKNLNILLNIKFII